MMNNHGFFHGTSLCRAFPQALPPPLWHPRQDIQGNPHQSECPFLRKNRFLESLKITTTCRMVKKVDYLFRFA
jgi:hypothetical protein